jgi:hypothetical protein
MRGPGLFAHLVGRFATHPENLATEALAYVLSQSPEASAAVTRLVRAAGVDVSHVDRWTTQVSGEDGALPDLVGESERGSTPIIIESKFWAGLTDNQPNTYLRRLPLTSPGVVLVVAPAVRIDVLWAELVDRASDVGAIRETRRPGAEFRLTQVGPVAALGLCNWRHLLAAVSDAVAAAGDLGSAGDLQQLAGLCEQMDTTAFLPLRSEELTGAIGSRMVQLYELVDSTATELVNRGIASGKDKNGGRLTSGTLYWGRYLTVAGVSCMLRLAPMSWAAFRATPVWLQVGYRGDPEVGQTLRRLAPLGEVGSRVVEQPGFVDVGIDLPIGVERDGVIQAIVAQVTSVAELLAQ